MEKNFNDLDYKENKREKKSLKKKIIGTAIGVIVLGTVSTCAYCVIRENNFKRVVNEEGDYNLENFISYDNLKDYNLVEIGTIIGENKLFIVNKYYNDIFTGKEITSGQYTRVVNEQLIEDYLIAYDLIKAKYSKEDIETLLEKINEDYECTKDKTLVKE